MRIGILGATGPAGKALGARVADLGHDVWVGSRDAARAEEVVADLRGRLGDRVASIRGVANAEAAEMGEMVVIAVPWQAAGMVAADAAGALSGKIVISMANALERRDDEFVAIVPPDGSVAAGVAKAAPESRVVAAFHHVPARELAALDEAIDGDVLVCSDDRDAAQVVCDFVGTVPRLTAIDVGGLGNAVGIEAFTAVLLSVNRRYKVRTGVRLTGLTR
ncbi:MAG TPA: NADPH-dependent F420 reductase [Acidimicrobiia bacterium]|nr:NADPH-dependent F420 reductase [Acidimicrobiia bacterium]